MFTYTHLQYQTPQSNIIGPTDKHNDRPAFLLATRRVRVAPSSSKRRFWATWCLHYHGSSWVPLERVHITARQHGVLSQTQDNQSMTTK